MNAKYVLYPALAALALTFALLGISQVDRAGRVAQSSQAQRGVRTIEIAGNAARVAVADTPESRAKGLGGREGLAEGEGMLFIFPADGYYAFWMKDMRFPIDILWLSASDRPSRDGSATATVIYIAPNVSPDTYPRTFGPNAPARYIVELPAGYVGAHGVKVGDIVRL